jgi:hypothetical protein
LSLRPHDARLAPARSVAALLAAAFAVARPATADSADPSAPLTPGELAVVDARLAPMFPPGTRTLELEPGGARFSTVELDIPAARLRGGEPDYEAVIFRPIAPTGIILPKRADTFRFTRAGASVRVTVTFAILAEPTAQASGEVSFSVALIERQGMANELGSTPVKIKAAIAASRVGASALAADFRGYRHYRARAEALAAELARAGLRGLTLKEQTPLPALERVSGPIAARALEFDRLRRRVGIARRHLEAAQASADRATSAEARAYLAALDGGAAQLAKLPKVPLVGDARVADDAAVEDLAARTRRETSRSEAGILQPLDTNRPDPKSDEPTRPEPRPSPPPQAVPQVPENVPEREQLSFERQRRVELVRPMRRGLTLDDVNVGFAGAIRFGYATVSERRSATVPTWFGFAQASLTPDLGVELTVPTALMSLDLDRAETVFTMGNPLLAAKLRFQLPQLGARRPVITARARYAMPIVARNNIPPTQFRIDRFSQPPTFADTYAFFLEKHMVGGGVSVAWEASIVHVAGQLYLDGFLPVGNSSDQTSFLALGYGVGVGVWPLEDWLGVYAEARGVRLFLGPNRTELFTYVGVKSRLLEFFEPAVFVGIPIGSIAEVTGPQLGVELRFSYDVESVVDRGRGLGDRDGL